MWSNFPPGGHFSPLVVIFTPWWSFLPPGLLTAPEAHPDPGCKYRQPTGTELLNNPRKLLYHNNQNKIITIRPELKNFSQKQLVERCYSKYFSHIKTVSVLKFSAPFSAKFSYMFDGTSSVNFTTHDIRVSTGERWKESNFLKRYKDKINQQIFMEESCVICFSDRPEIIFLPCGHFCMCSGCYGVYKTGLSYCRIADMCPICRKTINSTVQTNDL